MNSHSNKPTLNLRERKTEGDRGRQREREREREREGGREGQVDEIKED